MRCTNINRQLKYTLKVIQKLSSLKHHQYCIGLMNYNTFPLKLELFMNQLK